MELLFVHRVQFCLSECCPFYFSFCHPEPNEWVSLEPSVADAPVNDLLEIAQILDSGVVVAFTGAP